jgi:multisubunit Na+/H+ antiporter MnhF subunit
MNEWLWAATVLLVLVAVLALDATRRPAMQAVVGFELAGTLTSLMLLAFAVGVGRQMLADVAIVAAATSFAGTVVLIRFMDRSDA